MGLRMAWKNLRDNTFNLLATDFFFQILAHLYLKCE